MRILGYGDKSLALPYVVYQSLKSESVPAKDLSSLKAPAPDDRKCFRFHTRDTKDYDRTDRVNFSSEYASACTTDNCCQSIPPQWFIIASVRHCRALLGQILLILILDGLLIHYGYPSPRHFAGTNKYLGEGVRRGEIVLLSITSRAGLEPGPLDPDYRVWTLSTPYFSQHIEHCLDKHDLRLIFLSFYFLSAVLNPFNTQNLLFVILS